MNDNVPRIWPCAAAAQPGRHEQSVRALVLASVVAIAAPSSAVDAAAPSPPPPGWCYKTCVNIAALPPDERSEIVTVSLDGNCRNGDTEVACRDIGALLRQKYPTTDPEMKFCVDRKTKHPVLDAILTSLWEANLRRLTFACEASDSQIAPPAQGPAEPAR